MAKFSALLRDDRGFVVSSELVLIATIVVIGLITGLVTVRDQVIQELADVADAISEIDQSYSWSGVTAHAASTAGSIFDDLNDYCEVGGNTSDQSAGNEPQCLEINAIVAVPE
jgi:Flp pilus assembly pilin Flp